MCCRLEKGDSVSIQFTSCYLPTLLIFKKSVKESGDLESEEELEEGNLSISSSIIQVEDSDDDDSTNMSDIQEEEVGQKNNLSKADQRLSQHFKNRVEEIQKMSLSDKLNTTEVLRFVFYFE